MNQKEWDEWLKEIRETLKRAFGNLDATRKSLDQIQADRHISSGDITNKPVDFFIQLDDSELLNAAIEYCASSPEERNK